MLMTLLTRIHYIESYNNDRRVVEVSQQKWDEYIFNGNTEHPYYLHEDLRTVDFLVEYSDIVHPTLAVDIGHDNQPFIAEASLTYYTEPSILSTKAFHIKKGDLCYGMFIGSFYGIRSFPTYKEGWRIAVPYVTEDTLDEYESTVEDGHSPIYYVSTKALEKFSKTYFEQYIWETYKEHGTSGTIDNLVQAYLLEYDYSLYNAGYYISPDLFLRKWDVIVCKLAGWPY